MKYAVLFALLTGYLSVIAVNLGGWYLLLFWPALGFFVLMIGYLGAGPLIFGKRPDGTLHPLALLLLPVLLLMWGVWHLQRLLTSELACHEVAPGLWLGRRPLARELPPEVCLIVDLTAEFALATGLPGPGRDYLTVPTLDGLAPAEPAFRKALDQVLNASGAVYIHCALGHSRSATLAAAVLLTRGLADTVAQAESLMVRIRPGVRLMQPQRRLLHRLFPAAAKVEKQSDIV